MIIFSAEDDMKIKGLREIQAKLGRKEWEGGTRLEGGDGIMTTRWAVEREREGFK